MNVTVVLLFIFMYLANFGSIFTEVKYGRVANGFFELSLSSVIRCVVALAFFYVMSGFKLYTNKAVLLYSLGFAATVLSSQYLGLIVYKYVTVLEKGIALGAIPLAFSCVFGAAAFGEAVNAVSVLRVVLSMAALVSYMLYKRASDKSAEQSVTDADRRKAGLLILAVLVITTCFGTVVNKYFALLPMSKEYSNSFCFYTNVYCLIASAVFFVIAAKGKPNTVKNGIMSFGIKNCVLMIINTVCSNIGSLTSLLILAYDVPLNIYYTLTAALGVIIQVAVSLITEKKKIPIVPVALALAAAVVVLFS